MYIFIYTNGDIVTQLLLSCAIDQAIFMLHRANKAFDYLPSRRIKSEYDSQST